MRSKVSDLTETVFDETPYLQLLLLHTLLSEDEVEDVKEVKKKDYIMIQEESPGTELKALEWDILNPNRLINLEINNKRRTSNI